MKYLFISILWVLSMVVTAQLSIHDYKTRMHHALELHGDSCLDKYSWVVDSYIECRQQLSAVYIMNDSCKTDSKMIEVSR